MPHDFDTDHHFTGDQQAQYDSLHARGRTHYDEQRWYGGEDHLTAWASAFKLYGLKNSMLITERERKALAKLGVQ